MSMKLHRNKHVFLRKLQLMLWFVLFFSFGSQAVAEEQSSTGIGMFSGRIIINNVPLKGGEGRAIVSLESEEAIVLKKGPYNISLFGGVKKKVLPTERANSGLRYNQQTGPIFALFLPSYKGQVVTFVATKTGLTKPLIIESVGGNPGNTFIVPTKAYGFNDIHNADIIARLPPNTIPIVNAGDELTGGELTDISLADASASDEDGDTLTYAWSILSGNGSLEDSTTLNATYKAPRVDSNGSTVILELAVSDGTATAVDVLQINIFNVPNIPPVAHAGTDQAALIFDELDPVQLKGEGSSDGDVGDTLTYQWTQMAGTEVVLSDSTIANPSFVSPEVTPNGETLTFELEVNDGKDNGIATDRVNIQISNVNKAPVANAGDTVTALMSSLVQLDGLSSSDPDGDALLYLWVQNDEQTVVLNGGNTATPTFTAPNEEAVLSFKLTVSDNGPLFHDDNVIVNVTPNTPPTANAGVDINVHENDPVTLNGSGSAINGTIVGYLWEQISGLDVTQLTNANTATPTFTAPNIMEVNNEGEAEAISLIFKLTVTDNNGLKATDLVNITVEPNLSCFIATAAFGTPMASQVQVLRDFRDSYLMTNDAGRMFVNFYYNNSPVIANYIAQKEGLRTATRWTLMPIIYVVEYPAILLLLVLMLFIWKKRTLLTTKNNAIVS